LDTQTCIHWVHSPNGSEGRRAADSRGTFPPGALCNYAFDEFWDHKYRQWLAAPQEAGSLFDTPEDLAAAFASRWAMIPLTRAMDTLVINVSTQPGVIRDALERVHSNRADFVEWIKV
jgi:hypothetical protein